MRHHRHKHDLVNRQITASRRGLRLVGEHVGVVRDHFHIYLSIHTAIWILYATGRRAIGFFCLRVQHKPALVIRLRVTPGQCQRNEQQQSLHEGEHRVVARENASGQ